MNLIIPDSARTEQREVSRPLNTDSAVTAIAKLAANGAGTEIIEQMKKLVEWDEARRAKAAFNAAFSQAKGLFKKAKKSGYNSHLKSAYSLLEDYDDATRDALTAHGLSWRHIPATLDGDVTSIRCIIAHRDGHTEEAELRAPSHSMTNNAVNKLQSTGIVVKYLERLTLCAMLGLVSDSELDNDGIGGVTVEPITAHQAADLRAMLDETKADQAAFLTYLSTTHKTTIRTIEEMPATLYPQAVAAVEQKRRQIGEKKP